MEGGVYMVIRHSELNSLSPGINVTKELLLNQCPRGLAL